MFQIDGPLYKTTHLAPLDDHFYVGTYRYVEGDKLDVYLEYAGSHGTIWISTVRGDERQDQTDTAAYSATTGECMMEPDYVADAQLTRLLKLPEIRMRLRLEWGVDI